MHAVSSLLVALASAAVTLGAPSSLAPAKRAADTTTVNLGACGGSPQLFAQGILYGWSGTNTPPQKYLQELSVNYESAGGAQTDQNGGYANSYSSYQNRFAATVAAWKRIRAVNGVMIVKMADLYGVDFTQSNSTPYPGDNGEWTLWTNFLNQFISDIKSNGMANSYTTQLEIWNEPDINFGGRPQSQYNEMYVRGTKALRNAFPSGSSAYLPLVGPSTSSRPYNGNGWWNNFLSYLQNNGGQSVQPDVWNWHLEENNNNDPIPPAQYLPGYVKSYGLTPGIGLQNNEFGIRSQQTPAYASWFRSRYERLQFNGLRGNWASGSNLSDLLADLLIKNSDGSYSTTGEYQTYKYYKLMNGSPCTTTSGSSVDSYATASSNNATALVGSQSTSATTNAVTFSGISKQFGSVSSVRAQLINIPYNNGNAVNGWTNSGAQQTLTVSNDQVTVNINVGSSATNDAWAVRIFK